MADFVVILLVVLAIGAAVWYIRREKKKGVMCIGCPDSGACARKNCGGCSGTTGSACNNQKEKA